MRDVVVIGSGAGGAPLALRLSQAGLNVLVLEKGPRHERLDYVHDEVLEAIRPSRFVPSPADDPHVLVDHGSGASGPEITGLGWIACCVGGGTAHMGGSLYRFHPDDFRLREVLGPYESVVDWPYTYDDLEPYYTEAEWELGVSGAAGANPFEGPRSKPFPMAPLRSHPLAACLDETCRRLGLHPFPTPKAINSEPFGGRPACAYCSACAGHGCPVGARGSTQEALLPRAEQTGRCEVRPRAMVREVTVGPDGRATGCTYLDERGMEHHVRARIVCVSCSAVESARLLLLSKSPLFPDGLANGNGLVGRNLQFHVGSSARGRLARDRRPDASVLDRHPFLVRSLMDHYFLPRHVSIFRKGGVHLFELTRMQPIGMAQNIALRSSPQIVWGEALKDRLWRQFRDGREVFFEVFQDFVPNERTLVELDPEVKDRWGLPAARIQLAQPDHHRRAARWLTDRGLEVLEAMGADSVAVDAVGYLGRAMVHGTCRAGRDPAASVLNEFCRSHEVPNLFVVDGSFMPTSGGAPSTLTIVANSLRTADYILEGARRGDL